MVRRMPNHQPALTDTFRALADPTRYAVVERLSRGPAPVADLARPFDMKLPTFLQHLSVLEEAGIVVSTKHGRVRTCALRPEPLMAMERWLAEQRSLWTRRLDQLDAFVTDLARKEPLQ